MKYQTLTPVLLAVIALLGACSSSPNVTSLLEQTRTEYRIAQADPAVVSYAPLELKQAGDAMQQANAAAADRDNGEKVDQLAYLARQKTALAQEVAKRKLAEAEVANAGHQRDQLRLDQRTNEAQAAQIRANNANLNAMQSQDDAARAKQQAQQAQDDAARSRLQTQQAQDEAAAAQMQNARLAAQLEAQLAELAAKKTERGIIITLGDVLFGTDLSRLNSQGMATAQKLATLLQDNPQRRVLVEGFADSTGAADYNQGLSERRASAVQFALLELGIGPERVSMRGYGESYPVAGNDTAQERQLNRRVEIVLSDAQGQVMGR